ncbi:MAG TPA: CBS domain-containing protein [Terriglobales bacterium]|jgi:CBS domain-containing protein|nr:CBS domain-containing protein [Terriglobales bacterium]
MASIYDLVKDKEAHTITADQSVLEAARHMVAHNIGALPVLRDGELVGIFSERDIMKRVVAEGRDPAQTRVSEVMTPRPLTVEIRESIENCMLLMKEHGFRHLPICDGRTFKGIVSLRDILLRDLTEKDEEVRLMRAYIHGS